MILLVVFGGLVLILGLFYLVNSWQQYHEWKWATFIVLVSLAATVYGAINLPYWHHHSQDSRTAKEAKNANGRSFSSFSNSELQQQNGQTQENKEMAVLRQLQKAYAKMGSVSFDSDTKTFRIQPKDGDESKAISYIIQNPNQADQAGWPNLTKSLISTSKQLNKMLGSGYSISLMNPDDSSAAVFTVKDGKQTYTAVK
ncbi:DUF308 domain-containing protein [uncultured Limosilactobacillus sp.]|uniref:DUF308 domain-containing protein n=1 Tax=uncultured Limosilactobacillus sp. TaxID=2837629 RepID=UPI0025FED3F5|nr:DUF308 domain-containing protein [uncultured Limosilactobacillus sp.]